jgi:4-hydroxythreonine-4-phosphate dehydrogenase
MTTYISMGDPCGIGPEIIIKAFQAQSSLKHSAIVVGDVGAMQRAAHLLGTTLADLQITMVQAGEKIRLDDIAFGQVCKRGGQAAFDAIIKAVELVQHSPLGSSLRSTSPHRLTTAPLSKKALQLAGHTYPGHTELLAELAGQKTPFKIAPMPVRMMLANHELRVVLVSIHLSLREALDAVTVTNVHQTIAICHEALTSQGMHNPRIAVAGLNPHAGESGLFGNDEIEIISPAIAAAHAQGINVSGPFPPDTIFMRARGFSDFDVVISMYHDQGLIPVKYMGMDTGVNVTLGLAYLRTSPDHGTAFDIAGKGIASAASMLAALNYNPG